MRAYVRGSCADDVKPLKSMDEWAVEVASTLGLMEALSDTDAKTSYGRIAMRIKNTAQEEEKERAANADADAKLVRRQFCGFLGERKMHAGQAKDTRCAACAVCCARVYSATPRCDCRGAKH